MSLQLSGRVAAITGGTKGIGLAIAEAFAAEGATVAVCGRDGAHAEAVAEAITARQGTPALGLAADATDTDSMREFVAAVRDRFGHLEIVVHSAGSPHRGRISDAPEASWLEALDTKLMGAVRLSRAALEHLPADGRGRIILIAGAAGQQIVPGAAANGVVNAAVLAFTSYLASEAADQGVRVSAISPGMVRTASWEERARRAVGAGGDVDAYLADAVQSRQVSLGRLAEPSEVAAAAVFLASDGAAYISGGVVPVDGGLIRAVR